MLDNFLKANYILSMKNLIKSYFFTIKIIFA